ncbi:MAG: RHS repeat-associated core domain-containing protein [Sphingomonadaceae bacterium]|nr:RHS repeat-associated core domain-containing protein [Sphingomonadaceae bacterium]
MLGTYAYDDLGRRMSLTRGNGTATSYGYDPVSRLTSLAHDMSGTTYDVATTYGYNAAGQIASSTRSNDAYAWSGHYNRDVSEAPNGLNQLVTQGAAALTYDGRGNVVGANGDSYYYTSENRLSETQSGKSLFYDPLDRLFDYNESAAGGTDTRFDNVGADIITELSTAGAPQRRYVHGPGTDEVLTWYEGSGTTDKRWLYQDERGSTAAIADASGTVTNVLSYDDYGIPAAANVGRFQYTGQALLPKLGMNFYKARIYSPTLGRFMQTDPIGYAGGPNWYNYVGSDPVNATDPSGLALVENKNSTTLPVCPEPMGCDIIVNAPRYVCEACKSAPSAFSAAFSFGWGAGPGGDVSAFMARTNPVAPQKQSETCKRPDGGNSPDTYRGMTAAGLIENTLSVGADWAGNIALAGAVFGQPEIAGPAGAISLALSGGKAYMQYSRGDVAGMRTTIGSSLIGVVGGQANRVVKIGGAGQAAFNAKIAAAVGDAGSRGVTAAVNCK